jgi:tetratricopeptide (TPR) repeat protein
MSVRLNLIGSVLRIINLAVCIGATCASPTFGGRFLQRQHRAMASPTGSLKVITGLPGSVVFINNVRHGATSASGTLDLPHVRAGTYPVKVRTAGYADWRGSCLVSAGSSRTLRVTQQATSDQAVLHYQKGDESRDRGKNDEAVAEYELALAIRPVFPEARLGMARSLITQQKFELAERQLLTAMKESGVARAEAQTLLANLRRYQGLLDESVVEYKKALNIAGGISPEAHIGLAIALEELGMTDESIKQFRVGITQDMDTEPILYYLLGSALEKSGANEQAIEAYRNYLRLDPEGQYASAVESMIEKLQQEHE